MDWKSLFLGVFSNGIWHLLQIAIASAIALIGWPVLLAHLRRVGSAWAAPLLYGSVAFFGGAALLILLGIQGEIGRLRPNTVDTSTPLAIQSQVEKWLRDDMRLPFEVLPDEPTTILDWECAIRCPAKTISS
jgi:hypothetical protein